MISVHSQSSWGDGILWYLAAELGILALKMFSCRLYCTVSAETVLFSPVFFVCRVYSQALTVQYAMGYGSLGTKEHGKQYGCSRFDLRTGKGIRCTKHVPCLQ